MMFRKASWHGCATRASDWESAWVANPCHDDEPSSHSIYSGEGQTERTRGGSQLLPIRHIVIEERRAVAVRVLGRAPLELQVLVRLLRRAAALAGSRYEAGLQQIRLDHVDERLDLFAHARADRLDARGAAFVGFD